MTKKHKKNRRQRQAARELAQAEVTSAPNRGKIEQVDFYGFPASVFAVDLKRTAWATLTILVILGIVVAANR